MTQYPRILDNLKGLVETQSNKRVNTKHGMPIFLFEMGFVNVHVVSCSFRVVFGMITLQII